MSNKKLDYPIKKLDSGKNIQIYSEKIIKNADIIKNT